MSGYIFYYFLEKNGKQVIVHSEDYLGDVGEYTFYQGKVWKITDYAYEFETIEEEAVY